MKTGRLIAIVAAVAALTGSAMAQVKPQSKRTPVINHREVNQQRRIARGVRSGTLTRGETRRLERQQIRIQRTKMRDKAMNGGALTGKEKTQIRKMQNRASRHIYRAKHNSNVRH